MRREDSTLESFLIIAPKLDFVCTRDGFEVRPPSPGRTLLVTDASILNLLIWFTKPNDPQSAVDSLLTERNRLLQKAGEQPMSAGSEEDTFAPVAGHARGTPDPHRETARHELLNIVELMRSSRVLISAASEVPKSVSSSGSADEHLSVPDLAENIRLQLKQIEGDLAAFGPYMKSSATRILDELQRCSEGLSVLAAYLYEKRWLFVANQLSGLGLSDSPPGLKLHVGCGKSEIATWVNIDVHPAELSMNLNWGLPFGDDSARYVFCAHTLEHLEYPGQALALLRDFRRVLERGGVLRLIVPDTEKCLKAYAANDDQFFEMRRSTWSWWPPDVTRLTETLLYAGSGQSDSRMGHKFGYDFLTLQRLLSDAGFSGISRSEFMASVHEDLRVDDRSRVAAAAYRPAEYYSLFVEAVCP